MLWDRFLALSYTLYTCNVLFGLNTDHMYMYTQIAHSRSGNTFVTKHTIMANFRIDAGATVYFNLTVTMHVSLMLVVHVVAIETLSMIVTTKTSQIHGTLSSRQLSFPNQKSFDIIWKSFSDVLLFRAKKKHERLGAKITGKSHEKRTE